jgi:hypothetical protein
MKSNIYPTSICTEMTYKIYEKGSKRAERVVRTTSERTVYRLRFGVRTDVTN